MALGGLSFCQILVHSDSLLVKQWYMYRKCVLMMCTMGYPNMYRDTRVGLLLTQETREAKMNCMGALLAVFFLVLVTMAIPAN